VFDVSAFQPDDVDRGTLWAARAPALRRPGGPPEAALTLSCREADRLRSLGLPALSLLHSRTIWPTREPRSVAVSAGRDVADLLPAVLPRLRRALGPATTVRLLASDVLDVGRARFAPVHTEARTRVIEAADLVVAVGESSGAGLDVFEAALHGTPVVRWSTAAASFEPDPAGHDDEGTGWMRRATSGTSLTPVRGPADDQTRTATRPELSRWAEELLDLPFS
jgi:hypothetical protein